MGRKNERSPLSEKENNLRLRLHNLRKEHLLLKRLGKMRLNRPRRRKRSKNPKFSMPPQRIKGRREEKRTRIKRKGLMWR
jgi:hypothetical protein